MNVERSLRVLPVILCAALATADAVGQGATDSATKSMKAPKTAQGAPLEQPASRGVRIGITINPLTDALAAQLGLEASNGLLVEGVVDGGPAAAAGLARYDVIVAMNDEPVSSENGLRDHLAGLHPGDTIAIKVLRKGETMLIPVVVDERPIDGSPTTFYGNAFAAPSAAAEPRDESKWREWAERQREWAERIAKQQAQWSQQLAEQSKAFAEKFKHDQQAEIEKWTAELVEHVDAWRAQANELNSPENRAKLEQTIRDYVNQLVEQAQAATGSNFLHMPSIRYYTTKDGKNQAIVESEGGAADVAQFPAQSADLGSRLDVIEQRMQKIERMLEKIANAEPSAGK